MIRKTMRALRPLWPFGYKRVLVLEDDTAMQKLVRHLLRPLHVRTHVFGNGRDVVRRIDDGARYDALLLDLMMPHDGGLTVLRHLRENQSATLSRVILMTGSGSSVTDRWSHLVFAVVPKPFDRSVLKATVRACLLQPGVKVAA